MTFCQIIVIINIQIYGFFGVIGALLVLVQIGTAIGGGPVHGHQRDLCKIKVCP